MTERPHRILQAGSPSQQIGRQMEWRAWCHLQAHGHRLLCRNYYCRLGEIDLITVSGSLLVFVEVRWRRHPYFGGALASVTAAKQRRLRRCANHFLLTHPNWSSRVTRFDVMAFCGDPDQPRLDWILGAF